MASNSTAYSGTRKSVREGDLQGGGIVGGKADRGGPSLRPVCMLELELHLRHVWAFHAPWLSRRVENHEKVLRRSWRETARAGNKVMTAGLESVGWFPEMDVVRDLMKEVREK